VPKRIMVINDTQEILDLFDAALTDEGYEVFLYSYAVRDMHEVERIAPDLIILDLMFGSEAIGWQVLQKLRMNRATAAIPVVVCTAATNAVREMEGHLQSQGVSVVPKPFQLEELFQSVERALEFPNKAAGIAFLPRDASTGTAT
jgi:DNA-binding response OmpR family regulator